MSICPVLMAGGAGTRLWPLSRASHPKQFLRLNDEYSLLQNTIRRLSRLDTVNPITVCNEEHRFFVAEQLREIGKLGSIILEPVGRNTAPAIALAALSTEDDPLLLVLPADHTIKDEIAFTETIKEAIPLAEEGKLVTFGVIPREPHTGYGYIQCGEQQDQFYFVDKFVEKPTLEIAEKYLSSNKYLWNSGIFLFKASSLLEELEKFRPNILSKCKSSIKKSSKDHDFLRIDKETFQTCKSESIDYAVMENTSQAVVLPLEAGWNDIGSWSSLWDISVKDDLGNTKSGDVILYKTHNSYVKTDSKLVAAVGVKDIVIVETKDALLVANKENVEDIKLIIKDLKDSGRTEWQFNREVHRPWGNYDSIDNGEKYQVKRITVMPKAKLSVQMHEHRSEHWVVVSGTAKVTNGENTFLLRENESTYIAAGVIHCLENPGERNLELIEIQTGSYLGEDDIVRFEDIYGRETK